MGFVIHKYLGKSLKAPAPSAKKTANDGTKISSKSKKRGSMLSVTSHVDHKKSSASRRSSIEGMDLEVPDSAYAKNTANRRRSSTGYSHIPPPRRNSNANHVSSSKDSVQLHSRRSSLQFRSDHTSTEEFHLMKQKSFRRSSLQIDSMYDKDDGNHHSRSALQYGHGDFLDDQMSVDEEDDFETFRRDLMFANGEGAAATAGFDITDEAAARLSKENRWLQLELRKQKRMYSKLERKLYAMRDQLAYTNASWIDQLHDAQSKHQEEVFQSQRQAEKAENAVLEAELEEWRSTLAKVVEASHGAPSPPHRSVRTGNHAQDLRSLEAELNTWKERHTQSVENARRIQDIMEKEAAERISQLEEAERRAEWAEAELEMKKLDSEDQGNHPHHQVALLQGQRAQLEDRVQELLLENSQLQKGQSQSYELQRKVHDLERGLEQAKEEAVLKEQVLQREIHGWKEQLATYLVQNEELQARLQRQQFSREEIQAEYAHRLEILELENHALKEKLEKNEIQYGHQLNMKQNTIGHLRAEIANFRKAAPDLLTGSRHQRSSHTSLGGGFAGYGGRTNSIYGKDAADFPRNSSALPDITTLTDDVSSEGSVESMAEEKVPGLDSIPDEKEAQSSPPTPWESELLVAQQREKDLLLQISSLTEKEFKARHDLQEAANRIKVLESFVNQHQESQPLKQEEAPNLQIPRQEEASIPRQEEDRVEMVSRDDEIETSQLYAHEEPSSTASFQKKTPRSSFEREPKISGEELVEMASSGTSVSQSLHERLEQERQRLKERRSRFLSK